MSSSSHVLLLASNSIQSLVPSSLITQVESLLDAHKLEDAFNLADARRKKLEESLEVNQDESEELHYLYQRIGFKYFSETLFEDAGNNFFNGHLDPRVLVSYYPDLRGNLFSDNDHIDLFAGVAQHMPQEASVDDIVIFNLVRNYSPHLAPNTASAPPTAELRRVLQERAVEMLETFLKKERRRRIALNLDCDDDAEGAAAASLRAIASGGSGKGKGREEPLPIRAIIDTVLAKLYARLEKTTDLYDLLLSSNHIIIPEVEDAFKSTGQYNALCILYQKGGETYDEKLLEVWSKVVQGEWSDPDIPDPLLQMISLLTQKRDKTLTQRWGIWLTKRDPEAGIRLLTTLHEPSTSGKRRNRDKASLEDDMDLLRQLSDSSPTAGMQYLEYLIFQKRTNSKDLHQRFASWCVDEVLRLLDEDESIVKLWKAKASSYASSSISKFQKSSSSSSPPHLSSASSRASSSSSTTPSSTSSFLAHFVSTTPDSPSKRARLRGLVFLCGSQLYDPHPLMGKLQQSGRGRLLALEYAVLDGMMGNHKSALTMLASELRDAASAEAYCALGGEAVVPLKALVGVAESVGLREWVDVLVSGGTQGSSMRTAGADGGVKGGVKGQSPRLLGGEGKERRSELLKVLLEVYLNDGSGVSSERAAHLINSQTMNLDLMTVITLVPPTWPLPALEPFLARSFRRIAHKTREAKIAKNISAGLNLEVREATYEDVREAGALVEEEEEEELGGEGAVFDEKKVEYDDHVDGAGGRGGVVDILPNGSRTGTGVVADVGESLLFSEKGTAGANSHGGSGDVDLR